MQRLQCFFSAHLIIFVLLIGKFSVDFECFCRVDLYGFDRGVFNFNSLISLPIFMFYYQQKFHIWFHHLSLLFSHQLDIGFAENLQGKCPHQFYY
jgi:hypothetical protein